MAQPSDVSVTAGQSARFSVVASAAAYQWQRFDGAQWVPIAGETGSTYTILAARTSDDATRLRVMVMSAENAADVLPSTSVVLTVTTATVPPSISISPGDLTVVAGQGGTLSVTAAGSSLTYRWQRSQAGGGAFADVAGADTATLVLANATLADDGASFRVVVGNSAGSATSTSARLQVTPAPAAPLFTKMPADMTVVSGQSATFSAAVTGTPTPTLGWQVSTDSGAQWTDILGERNTSLVLATVSTNDTGKRLRAVASNSSGVVVTHAATLAVTPQPVPPTITLEPIDVSVGTGATPSFDAAAQGSPGPSLQWQVATGVGATFFNITGAMSSTYALPPVGAGDDGKRFRLLAQNASGFVFSRTATLSVRPAPQITKQPQSQAWRPGLVLPVFQVGAAGSGVSYRWQMRSGASSTYTDIPGATTDTVVVSPPDADSSVRAIVTNAAGDTTTSDAASLIRLRWSYLSPQPSGDAMRAVRWIDATTLVGVGDAGSIVRSTDGGSTWSAVRETDLAHAQTLHGADFTTTGVGLAVGEQGLIERTVDRGIHWRRVREAGAQAHLAAVAFDTDQVAVAVGATGTMLRSADGGLSWTSITSGTTEDLKAIAFRAGVGIAVTSQGTILRTINGGAQWSTFMPNGVMTSRAVSFATDDVIVIVGNGVLRSTDKGLTWTYANPDSLNFFPADVAFRNGNVGIALPLSAAQPVHVTADGGFTWTATTAWQPFTYSAEANGYSVRFGSNGEAVASGSFGALRRSIDNGTSWVELTVGSTPTPEDLRDVAFGSPTTGVAISSGTVYRTTDGGAHWTSVMPNFGGQGAWIKVAFVGSGTVFALEREGRLYVSHDSGATWSFRSRPTTEATTFAFADANLGLMATYNDGVLRTTDGGTTWIPLGNAAPNRFFDITFVDGTTAIGSSAGLYRSTDAGMTWQPVFNGIPFFIGYETMTVGFASSNVGIAVGDGGSVVRTVDGGATWQVVASYAGNMASIRRIWFNSALEGFISALGYPTLRTVDGGVTWSVDQALRSGGLTHGVALDASTSIVVGRRGIVMRRGP